MDTLSTGPDGPTTDVLAAIEAEWPLIAAELELTDAEIRVLTEPALGAGLAPAAPGRAAGVAGGRRVAGPDHPPGHHTGPDTAGGVMAEVRTAPLPRAYPMPAPGTDPRFTYGLLIDIADVLHTYGYPRPVAGGDLVALQQALFRFLYDTTRQEATR